MSRSSSKKDYNRELRANSGFRSMGVITFGLFTGLIGAALCYLISLIYHRTGMDLPAYIAGSLLGSIYIYSILFFAALLLKSMTRPKTFSFYEFQGKWSDRRRYVWLDGHAIAVSKILASVLPALFSYIIGCAVMLLYSRFMGLPMIQNFVVAFMIICMFAIAAEYLISLALTLVFRERSIETVNFILSTAIVQAGLYLSGFYRYRDPAEFLGFISGSTSITGLSFLSVTSVVILIACGYLELTSEKRQNNNRMIVASNEAFDGIAPIRAGDRVSGPGIAQDKSEGLKIPILEPDDGPPGERDTGQDETEIPMETPKQQQPDESIKRNIEPVIATAVEGKTMSELENKNVERTVEAIQDNRQSAAEAADRTVQFTGTGAQVYRRPSQQKFNTQTIQAAVQSGTGSYVRASQPNARVFRRSETESERVVNPTVQRPAVQKPTAPAPAPTAEIRTASDAQRQQAERLRAQAIAQAQAKAAQTQQQRIAEQLAAQKAKAEEIQRKLAEIQARQRQRATAVNEPVAHTQTVNVKYDRTSAAATAAADLRQLDFFPTPALDGTANSTTDRVSTAVPKASVEGSYTSQGNASQMPESATSPAGVSPAEEFVQRKYEDAAESILETIDSPETHVETAAAVAAAEQIAAEPAAEFSEIPPIEEDDYYEDEEDDDSIWVEEEARTDSGKRRKGVSPWIWVVPLMLIITGLLVAFGLATFNSFTGAGESEIANTIFGLLLNEQERDFLWTMGESTYGLAFLGVMSGCLLAIDIVLLSLGISITKRRRR